jgi:hypothetical protein
MKNKFIAVVILLCLFLPVKTGWGQTTQRFPLNASLDPCPGGGGSAKLEPVTDPNSLETLVRPSDLIIIGSVVQNLPAVLSDRTRAISIETHSLISVDQVLLGTLRPNSHTIVIVQFGGQVPPCKLIVSDYPIVTSREQYILFLQRDERQEPVNTTGSPRFAIVGIWSGRVKIENGNIQFPSEANDGLHKYDNSDLNDFITRINAILHPLPPPSPNFPPPIPVPPSSPFSPAQR